MHNTTAAEYDRINNHDLRSGDLNHRFMAYEWSKQMLSSSVSSAGQSAASKETPSVAVPLTAGAFAATAAWGVGYPFDTIKTRIQVL